MDTARVLKVVVINTFTFFQVWQSLYDPYFLSFCQSLSPLLLEQALTPKLDTEKGNSITGQRHRGSKIQKFLNLTLAAVAYKPLPHSWFNTVYKKRKGMVSICYGKNE